MFENYPKIRPALSEDIQKFYLEHYKSNRNGSSRASNLANKMERWLHRKVSADVNKSHNKKTLEIGAGTLNQLQYEMSSHYDIIEPFDDLFNGASDLFKINKFYKDIDDIELSSTYDRIISIATFEHILDLPKVVAKSCLLLKENGTLRTSIPNEGTLLWTLGWKFTTGLEFKLKHGLEYSNLLKHEHVNTADEIEEILNYFFNSNVCSVLGLNKKIAFYRYYESKSPNIERAQKYLDSYEERL